MKKVLNRTIAILLILIVLLLSCPKAILDVNATETVIVNGVARKYESNSTTSKFYSSQLDGVAKKIYDKLEKNIDNLKKDNCNINFFTDFNELLHKSTGKDELIDGFQIAVNTLFYEHPELFYIDITKIVLTTTTYYNGQIKIYEVKISPHNNKNFLNKNFTSEKEVDNAISQVEKVRDEIVKSVSGKSNYNKVLEVHNKLVNSIKYDTTLSKSNGHNIYGALIEKEVVCEGYAKAFKYILDYLDIESITVSGIAYDDLNNQIPHMWNYVKMNGVWYGVDVTWDDPVVLGGDSDKGILIHDYFLKGSNVFGRTHIPDGRISVSEKILNIPMLSYKNYEHNTEIPFEDVIKDIWYYDAVKYVYENNIIKGMNDYTFNPNGNLTRGMLVTILWRIEGSPKATTNQFTDVSTKAWYYDAVNWAAANKIVNGYGNGKFGPQDNITREQLAVILKNYAGVYKKKDVSARADLSKFKDDASIASYAKDGVSWAVANKIISGKENGTKVDPKGKATRAEAAAMLRTYCLNVK